MLADNGKTFVWVLAPDRKSVARRFVEVAAGPKGDHADSRITAGLTAGDRVVTVGVHSLSDGQAVAGQLGAGIIATKAGETHL